MAQYASVHIYYYDYLVTGTDREVFLGDGVGSGWKPLDPSARNGRAMFVHLMLGDN